MSPTSLSLPARTLESYDNAVEKGWIELYAASERHELSPATGTCTQHLIHCCPSIAAKPAVPLKTPDLSSTPTRDPFSGPSYGPNDRERVMDLLDLGEGYTGYSIVHNMHALMSEHEMIVPSFSDGRPFRPQTSDLLEGDFAAAWRVVGDYAEKGREVIMFFNGGPLAGASQPHLHMQFCPFQSGPPGPEAVARSLDPAPPVGEPTILPLPWTVFYARLPSSPDSASLYKIYRALLAASHAYLANVVPPSDLAPEGVKRDSYNLFLTATGMHLIPRRDRLARIPRKASRVEGEEGEQILRLSVNGLLVMGYWYVGTREEAEDLANYGVERVLQEAAYRNDTYKP